MCNLNKIKSLARENGLSMSFLCKKLGLGTSYFNDIKISGKDIPDDRLLIIANILDTTPEYLRDETDEKKPLVNGDEELTEYLNYLKNRPEMKMLFSLAKDATKEDVEKSVKIIEAVWTTFLFIPFRFRAKHTAV